MQKDMHRQSIIPRPRKSNIGIKPKMERINENTLTPIGSKVDEIGKTPSKTIFLKKDPTKALLQSRTIPRSALAKERFVDDETSRNSIFDYTFKLAQNFFSPDVTRKLFPPGFNSECATLQFLANSRDSISSTASSRIPAPRRSSIILKDRALKNQDFSLKNGFKYLTNLMTTRKEQFLNLIDFNILYSILAIIFSTASNVEISLNFLKSLLDLKFKRNNECLLLLRTLFRVAKDESLYSSVCIDLIVKLAKSHEEVESKLKDYQNSKSQRTVELSTRILTEGGFIKKSSKSYTPLSINAQESEVVEQLKSFRKSLSMSILPKKPSEVISNVTMTMMSFSQSSSVLLEASGFLTAIFEILGADFSVSDEVIAEFLSLCYSISSGEIFLSGDNTLEAIESIQKLIDISFKIDQMTLVHALSSVIAKSNGPKLDLLASKIQFWIKYSKEEIEEEAISVIDDTFRSFHPESNYNKIASKVNALKASIDAMLNPETSLKEIMRVTKESTDGYFDMYPTYLRNALTAAWLSFNNVM